MNKVYLLMDIDTIISAHSSRKKAELAWVEYINRHRISEKFRYQVEVIELEVD